VDIHVQQEPGHVEQANEALEVGFSAADFDRIVASAEEMWRLWIAFFDRLRQEVFKEAPVEAVATA
jgi:hypothetical protein